MKRISKVTLETMRKELEVIENNSLQKIKGGYIRPVEVNGVIINDWACLFNCMEDLNKDHGGSMNAGDYYSEFKRNTGKDPAMANQGVFTSYVENGFSHSINRITNYNNLDDSLQEGGDDVIIQYKTIGKDGYESSHYVIGTGSTDDSYCYYDPTSKKEGKIKKDEVNAAWKVDMNSDVTGNLPGGDTGTLDGDDTGNLDDSGNY